MDADELNELKGRLMTAYMNDTFADHGVDMIFFMLTDILDESHRSDLCRCRSRRSGIKSIHLCRRRQNVSEGLCFPRKADHSSTDGSSFLTGNLPTTARIALLITG